MFKIENVKLNDFRDVTLPYDTTKTIASSVHPKSLRV